MRFIVLALVMTAVRCCGQMDANQDSPSVPHPLSRFEFGPQFSFIGFDPCTRVAACPQGPPQSGIGPALTVNLNRNFSIDASLAESFANDSQPAQYQDGSVAGGRATEFLAGPRATARSGRWGIFVGAEVGFLSWSHVVKDLQLTPTSAVTGVVTPVYGRDFFFAGEPKFGVEYTAGSRTTLRVEAGDELINYGQARYAGVTSSNPYSDAWASNATLKVAVLVGVGRNVRMREESTPAGNHRFFDRTNLTLMSVSLLGQIADGVTTQRGISRGIPEANAFAKPLVDQGWPGQIALMAIATSAQAGLMYGLHKMHHHRLERALPIAYASVSAYAAYNNSR